MKPVIIRKFKYRTAQARVSQSKALATTKQLADYVGRQVLIAQEKEKRT